MEYKRHFMAGNRPNKCASDGLALGNILKMSKNDTLASCSSLNRAPSARLFKASASEGLANFAKALQKDLEGFPKTSSTSVKICLAVVRCRPKAWSLALAVSSTQVKERGTSPSSPNQASASSTSSGKFCG